MAPEDSRQRDLERMRMKARSPEEFAALTEAMADRQREPGYFVVLGRQPAPLSPENLAAFASAIEVDPYTARQRLLAPTARIFRRYEQEHHANEWASWLRQLGMRAFAISEEAMIYQEFLPLAAVYAQNGELTSDDLGGNRKVTPMEKVCCLVLGEIIERRFTEQTRSNALLDDINYRRENLGYRNEVYIDIHFRHTPISMRICQDTFQFQRLFPDRNGASSVLIRELFQRLKKALPDIEAYDEFKRAQDVLGTSEQLLSSSTYLASNWGRPSVGNPIHVARVDTKLETNAEAFNIYSTLARLETLRA